MEVASTVPRATQVLEPVEVASLVPWVTQELAPLVQTVRLEPQAAQVRLLICNICKIGCEPLKWPWSGRVQLVAPKADLVLEVRLAAVLDQESLAAVPVVDQLVITEE
jgi:hypothetical protein